MIHQPRISWDTTVKHYIRFGLYNNLPFELQSKISKSNKHRWSKESDDKYKGCEIAKFIKDEIELVKQIGKSRNAKKMIKVYLRISKIYHSAVCNLKGVKAQINLKKDSIVNTIEKYKSTISTKTALKIMNISRATYQNYKTLVLNKCDSSYFLWCVKKYPQQLLRKEIMTIKNYMLKTQYQYWSKSSVYFLAIRNNDIAFCLSTWYKYCYLLGYKNNRHLQPKIKYGSLKSNYPNHIWCADVTIIRTLDGFKYYLHFLMDHYSKMILGYKIETSSQPKAIKELLQETYQKYKSKNQIKFITDGGSENVNTTVSNFIQSSNPSIIHLIAQKDIPFSNSKIEAFNKIIKHQFLLPKKLTNLKQLEIALKQDVAIYNTIRPQYSLQGNTPKETFNGKPITIANYNLHFSKQKTIRIHQNQNNSCKKC